MYMFRVKATGIRRRQVRLALVVVMIATLAFPVATALAARGGNGNRGGGGGGGKGPTATLHVTPDPVAAGGATYTVTGSGFTPDSIVYINESRPGCCLAFNVWADGGGRIEFTRSTGFAGTYTIKAMQKKKRRTVTMAEVSFEVGG